MTTDRAAYLRTARLTVWTPRPDPTTQLGAFFGAIVPNALVVEDLRIEYSASKDGRSEPNKCQVKVTNLARTSRAEFSTLPKRAQLEVGYAGQLRRLFVGDVTYATHELAGTDWVTTLTIADGSRAYKFARVNRAMAAGTPAIAAIREVAKALGLPLPAAVEQRQDLRRQFAQGVTLLGRASDEMSKLLQPFGLSWSIQDGALAILDAVQVRPGDAIVLDEAAGLVDSPVLSAPKKPGDKPVLSARCLLYPEVQVGRLLSVRSRTVTGRFRVESVAHEGCNLDGDQLTSLEAKPL